MVGDILNTLSDGAQRVIENCAYHIAQMFFRMGVNDQTVENTTDPQADSIMDWVLGECESLCSELNTELDMILEVIRLRSDEFLAAWVGMIVDQRPATQDEVALTIGI